MAPAGVDWFSPLSSLLTTLLGGGLAVWSGYLTVRWSIAEQRRIAADGQKEKDEKALRMLQHVCETIPRLWNRPIPAAERYKELSDLFRQANTFVLESTNATLALDFLKLEQLCKDEFSGTGPVFSRQTTVALEVAEIRKKYIGSDP